MASKLALYKPGAVDALKLEVAQILAEPDVGLRLIKIDEMQKRLKAKDAPHRTGLNKFLRSKPVVGTAVGGAIVGPATGVGILLAPFDSGFSYFALTVLGGIAGTAVTVKGMDAASDAIIKDYLEGVIKPLENEKERFVEERIEPAGLEHQDKVWRVQEENFDELAKSEHLEAAIKKFPFLKDEFKRMVEYRTREEKEAAETRRLIDSVRNVAGQTAEQAPAALPAPTIPPKFRTAEGGTAKPRK